MKTYFWPHWGKTLLMDRTDSAIAEATSSTHLGCPVF
jgi:hypothetical protein